MQRGARGLAGDRVGDCNFPARDDFSICLQGSARSPGRGGLSSETHFRLRRGGVPCRVRGLSGREPSPGVRRRHTRTLVLGHTAVGAALAATAVRHRLADPGNAPEFGGRNASILQQYVHREELSRRRIYQSFNPQGIGIIAASLLSFGTPEQQRRWAVPILRAEITASLGMSDPEPATDFASLRTRAVLDGGNRSWSTGRRSGRRARTTPTGCWPSCRPDSDPPKHKGISPW